MTDDAYVIWSFEHRGWWRPGGFGYTPDLSQAGRYRRAEAERIVANANIVKVNEQMFTETDARAMRDDPIAAMLVTELARKDAPMEVVMAPPTVFQMTALVQLALRHPGVGADTRASADRFLTAVRAYFADCPAALDLVQRGDDPQEDR